MKSALKGSPEFESLKVSLEQYFKGFDWLKSNSFGVEIQKDGNFYGIFKRIYKSRKYKECSINLACCYNVEDLFTHVNVKKIDDLDNFNAVKLWKLFEQGLARLYCRILEDDYEFSCRHVKSERIIIYEVKTDVTKFSRFKEPKDFFDYCLKTYYKEENGELVKKKKWER